MRRCSFPNMMKPQYKPLKETHSYYFLYISSQESIIFTYENVVACGEGTFNQDAVSKNMTQEEMARKNHERKAKATEI